MSKLVSVGHRFHTLGPDRRARSLAPVAVLGPTPQRPPITIIGPACPGTEDSVVLNSLSLQLLPHNTSQFAFVIDPPIFAHYRRRCLHASNPQLFVDLFHFILVLSNSLQGGVPSWTQQRCLSTPSAPCLLAQIRTPKESIQRMRSKKVSKGQLAPGINTQLCFPRAIYARPLRRRGD